ncbi:MAG: hypothetical protein ACFFEF_17440 [Candidatus Thorarchaeota archaeon]
MEIKCELCGNTNWKIAIRELKVVRIAPTALVTSLVCESCGMMYPLYTIGTGSYREKIERILKDQG